MFAQQKNAYIDMVGDLFHYGHIRQIKEIKQQGYNVIIGLHSDKLVEKYKSKPIFTLEERIEIISACKYVDSIVPNVPLFITKDFMEKYKIDMCFHCHSEEQHKTLKQHEYKVPIMLKKFKRMDYCENISTKDIIDRIRRILITRPSLY